MSLDAVQKALDNRLPPAAAAWLRSAELAVAADPDAIRALFGAVGRHCGHERLVSGQAAADAALGALKGWTVDDGGRAVLIAALPLSGVALATELAELYMTGGVPERRGVLRALDVLSPQTGLGDGGLPLVREALRATETELVGAALGPYAAEHLDVQTYRQAVLLCVSLGIPLDAVSGVEHRADAELVRMLQAFAQQRIEEGRPVPADLWLVVPATTGPEPAENG